MSHEQKFLDAISESFALYKKHGARSPKKLLPIHNYVTQRLQAIWGDDCEYYAMGLDTKEATVVGKYYPKDIDISVFKDGKPIFCLGIKFITSNYKQNANNYFEGMMGETANIQATQIPYAHLIVMRHETPYYKKNNANSPSKMEVISQKDLQKYLNLIYDTCQAHRPEYLSVLMVDIDEATQKATKTNLKEAFGVEFAHLIEEKLSLSRFYQDIEAFQKFSALKQIK